jgi:flagellar hook-associated protein 3 FlgL
MASIVPIPTTRVGDYFVRQRLVSQVQNDSLALFNLQNQVSTGRRLQLPSDEPAAALRIINLQRLLERKDQIKTNIAATTNVLGEAENALKPVSDSLINLRAEIVGVAGNLSTEGGRTAAIQSVEGTLESLMQAGNSRTLGRYLFAGSSAQTQPFDYSGSYVEYKGNVGTLRNYVDVERLFETNLTGVDVFGGLSAQMKGTALSPQVNGNTLLSTLNDGTGISSNPAINVSIDTGSATVSTVVDLSGATTLDDVARAIEQGAPAGTDIKVSVNGTGLTLTTTSGNIMVGEVAQGHTAAELGILTSSTAPPSSTITGSALNSTILNTSKLSDLLGVKARATIQSSGANNDILLTANQNGTDFNDVRVVFVDDVLAGAETAEYDGSNPSDKTLTVHIQSGYNFGGRHFYCRHRLPRCNLDGAYWNRRGYRSRFRPTDRARQRRSTRPFTWTDCDQWRSFANVRCKCFGNSRGFTESVQRRELGAGRRDQLDPRRD